MLSTTAVLAAAMQCAASIHPATVLAVASIESGFNPYAIAEIVPEQERSSGSKEVISHQPASPDAAMRIADRLSAQGHRYSVGLMQITSSNFHHYGVTARDLLDPCINLAVFERIITDCYQRGGSLKRALSCYYSGNFATGQQPESTFRHTSYLQRVGYVVPSIQEEPLGDVSGQSRPAIHFPASVLRGDMTDKRLPAPTSLHYPKILLRGDVPLPEIKGESR